MIVPSAEVTTRAYPCDNCDTPSVPSECTVPVLSTRAVTAVPCDVSSSTAYPPPATGRTNWICVAPLGRGGRSSGLLSSWMVSVSAQMTCSRSSRSPTGTGAPTDGVDELGVDDTFGEWIGGWLAWWVTPPSDTTNTAATATATVAPTAVARRRLRISPALRMELSARPGEAEATVEAARASVVSRRSSSEFMDAPLLLRRGSPPQRGSDGEPR